MSKGTVMEQGDSDGTVDSDRADGGGGGWGGEDMLVTMKNKPE